MRKRNIKKRLAFLLALLMLFMGCVPAYARDPYIIGSGSYESGIKEQLPVQDDISGEVTILGGANDIVDYEGSSVSGNNGECYYYMKDSTLHISGPWCELVTQTQSPVIDVSLPCMDETSGAQNIVFDTPELPWTGYKVAGGAFKGYSNLNGITFSYVTRIGSGALQDCPSLRTIALDTYTGNHNYYVKNTNALFDLNNGKLIAVAMGSSEALDLDVPGITEIDPSVAKGYNGSSIIIPETIKKIGTEAFQGASIATLVFQKVDGLEIGDSAFMDCKNLDKIEFDDMDSTKTVSSIGIKAFAGCEKLGSLSVPCHIGKIRDNAFSGCTGLTNLTVQKTGIIDVIGEGAFSKCGNIPGCNSLVEFLIEGEEGDKGTVNEIGNKAFEDCTNLKNLTMRGNVRIIGNEAFKGCSAINSNPISLPEGLEKIGHSAFYGCRNIEGILVIPKSVKVIDHNAFDGCSKITVLNFGGSSAADRYSDPAPRLKEVGTEAFANMGLTEAFIPDYYDENENRTLEISCFDNNSSLDFVFFYGIKEDQSDESKLRSNFRKLNSEGSSGFSFDGSVKAELIYLPYKHCYVKFNPNGGEWSDRRGQNANKTSVSHIEMGSNFNASYGGVPKPMAPADNRDFQTFRCWIDINKTPFNFGEDDVLDGDTTIDYDESVYALYKSLFTIIFKYLNADGDLVTQETKVEADSVLDASHIPVIPELDYAPFKHWISDLFGIFTQEDLINDYGKVIQNDTIRADYNNIHKVNFYIDSLKSELLSENMISHNGMISKIDEISLNSVVAEALERKYPSDVSVFKGWKKIGDLQGYHWTSRKLVTEDIDFYPDYDTVYTLRFHYGEEYASYYNLDDPLEMRVVRGVSTNAPVVKKLPGYSFLGWYDKEKDSYMGKGYINPTRNMDLYAVWAVAHKVSFYNTYNGEPEFIDSIDVVSGDVIGLQLPEGPEDVEDGADSMAFSRWNTMADGSGTDVDRNTVVNAPMNAYTVWISGHTVKFYSEDRLLDRAIVEHNNTIRSAIGEEFPTPVPRLGYILKGWNTEPDGTGDPVTLDTRVISSLNVYAQWEDDPSTPNDPQVTVSFDSMGGSAVPSQTLSVNTLISRPNDPVWHDHKFLGWYKSPDYEEAWDFGNDMITEDMYLYAAWKYWTDENEEEYQDNLKGIYWLKVVKGEKASVAEYFKEAGLKYTYDKKKIKYNSNKRIVKGKRTGSTLLSAKRKDGTDYEKAVRVFVLKQELQDMYAFNTGSTLNAPEYLTVSGFLPEKWQSSKPSVAAIDPNTGVITVRGRGKATIRAIYKNRVVSAMFYSEVPKFTKPFIVMKTGQRKKLKIKRVKNYDIISWNVVSENSSSGGLGNYKGTAEIDFNGKLTALTAGDLTVYATVYGETISCKIHVEPPLLRTKSVVLNVSKTKKLKLSNTKLKFVEWISTNDRVAYVDPVSGVLYGLQPGRVTLKTTAGGVSNVCSVQVLDSKSSKNTGYNTYNSYNNGKK